MKVIAAFVCVFAACCAPDPPTTTTTTTSTTSTTSKTTTVGTTSTSTSTTVAVTAAATGVIEPVVSSFERLVWPEVAGAVTYTVAADVDGDMYVWTGTSTSVTLAEVMEADGPVAASAVTWFVLAETADGVVLATSLPTDIAG